MGKKKEQQESAQLSFFDTYEPKVPEVSADAEEEFIEKEPEIPQEIIPVEEEPEAIIPCEDRKPSLTEQIFDPMVIYFNSKDCPKEKAEEEIQAPANYTPPVSEQKQVLQEEHSDKEVTEVEPVKEMETGRGKRILITGASGFIGGFLVDAALERGYEVWAGIRMNSDRSGLTDERIRFIDLAYDNKEILTAQLNDLREEHGIWDYIIHNAGVTKTNDKQNFFKVNAENTHHFIEALNAAGCKPDKFMLMSSLSSYGAGDEKGFTPIGLEDTQRPDTAYGLSKLEAENYLRRQSYFPYVIIRPTGVYGPGERDYFVEIKSIRSGFDFAVGMTPQRITFIYVKDLARVAFLALEKEEIQNKHYFVADGDIYTDQSFARMIQDLLGKKRVVRARIPSGLVYIACWFSELAGKVLGKGMTLNTDKYKILKQRNWTCDVRPLQDDLGFTPTYSLRDGLKETIAWYKEHGWI